MPGGNPSECVMGCEVDTLIKMYSGGLEWCLSLNKNINKLGDE
jgi:hypothetical protein